MTSPQPALQRNGGSAPVLASTIGPLQRGHLSRTRVSSRSAARSLNRMPSMSWNSETSTAADRLEGMVCRAGRQPCAESSRSACQ